MHKRPVPDIDWSPDNLMLASVAEDGGVCLWQVDSGQLVSALSCTLVFLLGCKPFSFWPVMGSSSGQKDESAGCQLSVHGSAALWSRFISTGRSLSAPLREKSLEKVLHFRLLAAPVVGLTGFQADP